MKIAVISDIHDNTDKLASVLDEIKNRKCDLIFALGDYTSPEVFKKLDEAKIPIYAVFGNMDSQTDTIENWAREKAKDITIRREMNRIKFEGKNYALTHFEDIAEKLLMSGMYAAVFYGDTHKASQRVEEGTLIANPGAVKDGSFGIYDTQKGKFEIIRV